MSNLKSHFVGESSILKNLNSICYFFVLKIIDNNRFETYKM